MILLKATLIAGSAHKKFAQGLSLPALLFVDAQSEVEALKLAESELEDLGWATMAHEATKDVVDYAQFNGKDSVEAGAFQDAVRSGFGIVVYPDSSA